MAAGDFDALGIAAASKVGDEGCEIHASGWGVLALDEVCSVGVVVSNSVWAWDSSWTFLDSMAAMAARISYGHTELFTGSGAWASKVRQMSMTCGGGNRPKYCFLIA